MQSNAITSARYTFSVLEKRIIYLVALILNGQRNADLFGEITMRVAMKDVLQGDSKNYEAVKDAAKKLYHRTVELRYINDNGKKVWTHTGLICGSTIVDNTGDIEITVHRDLVLHYTNLLNSAEVTRLNLGNALSLKSMYSQRMYELISRFRDTGWYKVSVEDLRDMLKLEGKYYQWGIFRDRVICTAEKELKEKSDCWFTWKPIKTSKRITSIHFIIHTDVGKNSIQMDNNYNINYRTFSPKLTQVGLSRKQVQQICRLDTKEITETLYEIQKFKASNKVQSLPAYTWAVFNKKYFQLENVA